MNQTGMFLKHFELVILAWFLGLPLLADAGPAPWYKWQSMTGATVCAQTSPGKAWVRLDRVYVDPRCQRQDKSAEGGKERSKK